MYIYEQNNWPDFIWNNDKLFEIITKVSFKQGQLLGKMQSLGFDFRQEALLNNLTEEITKSSEIEGELLNKDEVRSSIARRLNIHNEKSVNSSHHVDGVVEIMIDATHNFENSLTYERLCGWHAALFPTGYSGMYKIKTACYRDDKEGPMQVVSHNRGREIVYYEAPKASLIKKYMDEETVVWFEKSVFRFQNCRFPQDFSYDVDFRKLHDLFVWQKPYTEIVTRHGRAHSPELSRLAFQYGEILNQTEKRNWRGSSLYLFPKHVRKP